MKSKYKAIKSQAFKVKWETVRKHLFRFCRYDKRGLVSLSDLSNNNNTKKIRSLSRIAELR